MTVLLLKKIDIPPRGRHNAVPMFYYEIKISVLPLFRDKLASFFAEKGALGFIEDETGIIAYFRETHDMQSVAAELKTLDAVLTAADAGNQLQFSCSLIPDRDWNEFWKKSFTPLDVGERFTILPPWERRRVGRINLVIDPGMAFGTGHHETTRSCLVLMERYEGKSVHDKFLDLGTGTGLLAIAASKLGFREILAVDTDPLATEAARMNVGLNNATNIEIREGSMDTVSGTYDCIAANIISGVLMLLAPDIASRLKPGGIAILSGILAEQADEVIGEMKKNGLSAREIHPDDKWISLVLNHEKNSPGG